jgi:cardiolipin synthase A/B
MSIPQFAPIETSVDGHRLTLKTGGQERLNMLLSLIDNARETLQLFFYIFADDNAGRQVRNALLAARGRGVEVSVLVDGFGSQDLPDSRFAGLVAGGVRFARFIPRWGRSYLLRNHQKMVIADRRIVLIGGANIADIYFADDPAGHSWHDLMLQVEGPAAARLSRYFDGLERWMEGHPPRLRSLVQILRDHSESEGAVRWQMGGPFRRLSPMTREIRRAIERAQSVDMIQAYFAPNWGFLRKLGRVAKRGSYRLITAAHSDNITTIAAARHCYRRLLRYGAKIFEYCPQMLHAKLLVVDDVTWIGSANFDMRSLYINTEIALRIEDKGFADTMRALVDAHLPHCEAIDRASHRRNSGPVKRLVRLISYFIVATVDSRLTRRFYIGG